MADIATIKPAEETVLSKLVKSIGHNLEELAVTETSIKDLTQKIAARYAEKLQASWDHLTVDELAEHFKLIAGLQLSILDSKRKLLIKGLEPPAPPQQELIDLFKLVNTPEKRMALESLLKSFERKDDL